MRLYLSSFDLGNYPDELISLARGKRRLAIVMNALDLVASDRRSGYSQQAEKLTRHGFKVVELDLRQYFDAPADLEIRLKSVDVLWINGGNPFILRRAMRQSGFDFALRRALDRDELVYAGFGAGVVVASRSMKGLTATNDSVDVPEGYARAIVWEGLSILPYAIVAHYRSDRPEALAVEQEVAFYEEHGMPYKTLRDGAMLVVDGRRHEIMGNGDA